MIKINGNEVTQKYFVFDGCHKFYLVDQDDFNECESQGYVLEEDVFPIEQIDKEFWNSCPLRFIQVWKTFENIVPQCADIVTFNINFKTVIEDFSKDEPEVTKPVVTRNELDKMLSEFNEKEPFNKTFKEMRDFIHDNFTVNGVIGNDICRKYSNKGE